MAIREGSATALVRARGLGIFCLNPNKKQGEMALIRDERHTLTLNVLKPVFVDGTGKDTINYQNIISYQAIDKLGVSIEIEGIGNPSVEGYEVYRSGDFDRLNGEQNDEHDFRWLVNIDGGEMHGQRLSKTENSLGQSRPPVSKLFIRNGLFYARTINENLFFERVRTDDAGGGELEKTPFGNVAETVAAKIEAEKIAFKIKIGGEEHTHILPRVAGSPYRIEISNMDLDQDTPISDMPDYYNFLADAGGVSFDLQPVIDEEIRQRIVGGAVGKKTSCQAIVSDAASIEEFL
jgi:hypothetical protein